VQQSITNNFFLLKKWIKWLFVLCLSAFWRSGNYLSYLLTQTCNFHTSLLTVLTEGITCTRIMKEARAYHTFNFECNLYKRHLVKWNSITYIIIAENKVISCYQRQNISKRCLIL
jgi:hypothetical protein